LAASLTIVRPINLTERGPAFLFFHGGGFVLGDFLTHERPVRDLVSDSEITAIFINYTRSPEPGYPTAINEAYAATKWVAANGDEINVDGKRLANSAGANIAAVTDLKCKLEGGPAFKGQLLFCPMTDANFETSSYNEYAKGYLITKNMMKWFWDNHVPDLAQRREVYASPPGMPSDD
jgi:acetyl esterase/lipase